MAAFGPRRRYLLQPWRPNRCPIDPPNPQPCAVFNTYCTSSCLPQGARFGLRGSFKPVSQLRGSRVVPDPSQLFINSSVSYAYVDVRPDAHQNQGEEYLEVASNCTAGNSCSILFAFVIVPFVLVFIARSHESSRAVHAA